MRQNGTNSDRIPKDFRFVNYLFNTGNIRSMIGQIVTEFHQMFQHLNE
jgi:hypothetical protein